jgi:hypothetical protein
LIKTSPKGFSASKYDVGNWIFSKSFEKLEIFWKFFGRNFLGEIFWEKFLGEIFWGGIFWENLGGFLEGIFLGGIFWEKFFGRIFLGGILWEESLSKN